MTKNFYKSLIIAGSILVLGSYEAYACFVLDQEPVWGAFSKKKIDLKIDFSGYYNKPADGNPNAGYWEMENLTSQKFFNFADIKPGDSGEGTISLHLKNQDAWGCAIIRPAENDDNGSTEPELLEDELNDTSDIWDGELAQNLNFHIWADICSKRYVRPGDNIYQPDCDRSLSSSTGPLQPLKIALADSENQNFFSGKAGPIKKDKAYYIGIDWNVSDSVGNIIQTDAYKTDITFYVKQFAGNMDFRCADINDGDTNKCVSGAMRGCYFGSANTKNVGICQGGEKTCVQGDWGRCVGEIIPVKEICADNLDNDCDGEVDEYCSPSECQHANDCNDRDLKTDDSCVNKKCEHKKKFNFRY